MIAGTLAEPVEICPSVTVAAVVVVAAVDEQMLAL